MTAPEVLVAEAREALLNGPVFRVERAETAPGGVKAVTADGVEFPKGRGLYAISEVTPSCVEAGTLDAPVGPGGLAEPVRHDEGGADDAVQRDPPRAERPAYRRGLRRACRRPARA